MSALSRFTAYLLKDRRFNSEIVKSATERMLQLGEDSPGALARILVSDFGMDHDQVYLALARHYAFPELNIDIENLDPAQVTQVSKVQEKIEAKFLEILFSHNTIPFRLSGKNKEILQVLTANPSDQLVRDIEKHTPFRSIEIYWGPLAKIQGLIYTIKHPPPTLKRRVDDASPQTIIEGAQKGEDVDDSAIDEEINRSFLVDLLDNALEEAVRSDASDVHVIPNKKFSVDIYFRIDGRLMLWHHQENTPPEALAAVIKDRSIGVDRFARDKAQDGYAQRLIDGHLIRFRVSILPMVSAEYDRRFESIVIRVIDDRKVITDLKQLGFQAWAEQEFLKAINTSKGIVIVTGPTGSGKSTTLMAALNHIIDPSLNVLTCEDPVEYVINGARQLKIGHNMSLDEAMRSILRHDPDVVMVGEIRDKITADIAVKLANTGHLTLTTLHTNDAPSAITRLYKMGIEPFLLAYSINIIIAQRLVRKLCESCRKPITPEIYPAALDMGFTQEEIDSGTIYKPVGCPRCRNGYRGRVNITEAMYFYPDIRAEIIRSSREIDEDRIRALGEKNGMLSMRMSGIERIRAGETSIAEVLYATAED